MRKYSSLKILSFVNFAVPSNHDSAKLFACNKNELLFIDALNKFYMDFSSK